MSSLYRISAIQAAHVLITTSLKKKSHSSPQNHPIEKESHLNQASMTFGVQMIQFVSVLCSQERDLTRGHKVPF